VAKPFFKWPGSKAWLLTHVEKLLPKEPLRVVEPFVGSAAFYLGSTYTRAMLGDTNEKVIKCLTVVRDSPEKVLSYLSKLDNCLQDYIRVRDELPTSDAAIAGRLIFLTNTSWGGLYRENRDGKFNVPFGANGRAFFCEATILSASERLQTADIQHLPFASTLAKTRGNDLIFVDAPYVTRTLSQHFDRYHACKFNWGDQLSLAKILTGKRFGSRKMIVTCASDANLYRLYQGWTVFEFSKRNAMAAYSAKNSYRNEAMLLSPALREVSRQLEVSARLVSLQPELI
jgi:DNA adenine methylase